MTEAKVSSCLDSASRGNEEGLLFPLQGLWPAQGEQGWSSGHLQVSPMVSELRTTTMARDWRSDSLALCFTGKARLAGCLEPVGCKGPGCSTPRDSQDPFMLDSGIQVGEVAPHDALITAELGSSAGPQAL